jgi:hypothetical protein
MVRHQRMIAQLHQFELHHVSASCIAALYAASTFKYSLDEIKKFLTITSVSLTRIFPITLKCPDEPSGDTHKSITNCLYMCDRIEQCARPEQSSEILMLAKIPRRFPTDFAISSRTRRRAAVGEYAKRGGANIPHLAFP